MKDRTLYGLLAGWTAPLIIIVLFWFFRFSEMSFSEFIRQSILLKVHLKLIAVGVFFADLAIFYLFLHTNKNNASKGVVMAVFFYFFLILIF